MTRFYSAATCLALIILLAPAVLAASVGYHLAKTYKLGGEGGWDYLTLDNATRRLFISRSTHVIVLDTESGRVVGDIADTPGVHGIALAPELDRGFVSNGREGTVTVFDLNTLKVLGKVKAGDNPDAILYDPVTKRVFTFNGRSHDSTAIDAAKGTVVGTIKLDGKPEFAVSDEKGKIFVNLEDTNQLLALDPQKLEVRSRWPLAPCESPSGLAMDRKNRRLFSGCLNNQMMAIINADTGKVITTLPIGHGVDATAFDPDTGLAFASAGEGILTVVKEESPDKFSVVENIPTRPSARTMALDPMTHRVFLATVEFGPAPAPTAQQPRPRPTVLPDSFAVLVLELQEGQTSAGLATTAPSVDLTEGETPQEVEKILGKPEDVTQVKNTLIYTYPAVKVFFENGKLVNVEERKK